MGFGSPVWIHSESMSTKTTFVLALAAGFLGGIVSQHVALPLVYAQEPTPIPTEIRAESFVIVDQDGKPRGAFGINKKWGPAVEIIDSKDHATTARFGPECFWSCKALLVPPQ